MEYNNCRSRKLAEKQAANVQQFCTLFFFNSRIGTSLSVSGLFLLFQSPSPLPPLRRAVMAINVSLFYFCAVFLIVSTPVLSSLLLAFLFCITSKQISQKSRQFFYQIYFLFLFQNNIFVQLSLSSSLSFSSSLPLPLPNIPPLLLFFSSNMSARDKNNNDEQSVNQSALARFLSLSFSLLPLLIPPSSLSRHSSRSLCSPYLNQPAVVALVALWGNCLCRQVPQTQSIYKKQQVRTTTTKLLLPRAFVAVFF